VPNLKVRPGTKRYLYGPGSIFVAHGDNEALTVRQIKEAVVGYKKLIQAAMDREEGSAV
jgi:acetylornithine deacetylase